MATRLHFRFVQYGKEETIILIINYYSIVVYSSIIIYTKYE